MAIEPGRPSDQIKENNMRVAAGLIFAGAMSLSMSGAAWSQDAAPVVKIHQGSVSGVVNDGTVAYKGIPFAAPPVGRTWFEPVR